MTLVRNICPVSPTRRTQPPCHPGQTHERAYALNRRSVWPKNTNWGLIGDAFHKFPTFIARIRRVNSIIFLYKDFMRLPCLVTKSGDVKAFARTCQFITRHHVAPIIRVKRSHELSAGTQKRICCIRSRICIVNYHVLLHRFMDQLWNMSLHNQADCRIFPAPDLQRPKNCDHCCSVKHLESGRKLFQ